MDSSWSELFRAFSFVRLLPSFWTVWWYACFCLALQAELVNDPSQNESWLFLCDCCSGRGVGVARAVPLALVVAAVVGFGVKCQEAFADWTVVSSVPLLLIFAGSVCWVSPLLPALW